MNAIRNKCADGSDARVHRKGEDAEQTAFSRPFNESAETVSHRPSAHSPRTVPAKPAAITAAASERSAAGIQARALTAAPGQGLPHKAPAAAAGTDDTDMPERADHDSRLSVQPFCIPVFRTGFMMTHSRKPPKMHRGLSV